MSRVTRGPRPRRLTCLALVGVAALPAGGCSQGGKHDLKAELTGEAEVPGRGHNQASGSVTVGLEREKGQVCFDLKVSGIPAATAAHIHRGAAGEAGEVLVTLTPPAGGSSKGCVRAPKEQIEEIRANPAGFYVNVHDQRFRNGAVRRQLHR